MNASNLKIGVLRNKNNRLERYPKLIWKTSRKDEYTIWEKPLVNAFRGTRAELIEWAANNEFEIVPTNKLGRSLFV